MAKALKSNSTLEVLELDENGIGNVRRPTQFSVLLAPMKYHMTSCALLLEKCACLCLPLAYSLTLPSPGPDFPLGLLNALTNLKKLNLYGNEIRKLPQVCVLDPPARNIE